jgi:hypothetical protein
VTAKISDSDPTAAREAFLTVMPEDAAQAQKGFFPSLRFLCYLL